jgi:hypothetical protein
MPQFALAACRRHSFGGSKGALYRETLQATGFHVGRVVIATAEFAPMPPLHLPGYPGGFTPTAIGMRFQGMTESIGPMWPNTKPKNQTLGTGPNRLPPVGPAPQIKERVGRTTPFSSSAMSSGRLFLDRVGRHQSPSPLHRQCQHSLIDRSGGTNYHQTVSSVLTRCLTFRDKRKLGKLILFDPLGSIRTTPLSINSNGAVTGDANASGSLETALSELTRLTAIRCCLDNCAASLPVED